eukprot:COSAG04_NODE_979_length_9034_cov_2.941354_3_plen_268_part_00
MSNGANRTVSLPLGFSFPAFAMLDSPQFNIDQEVPHADGISDTRYSAMTKHQQYGVTLTAPPDDAGDGSSLGAGPRWYLNSSFRTAPGSPSWQRDPNVCGSHELCMATFSMKQPPLDIIELAQGLSNSLNTQDLQAAQDAAEATPVGLIVYITALILQTVLDRWIYLHKERRLKLIMQLLSIATYTAFLFLWARTKLVDQCHRQNITSLNECGGAVLRFFSISFCAYCHQSALQIMHGYADDTMHRRRWLLESGTVQRFCAWLTWLT